MFTDGGRSIFDNREFSVLRVRVSSPVNTGIVGQTCEGSFRGVIFKIYLVSRFVYVESFRTSVLSKPLYFSMIRPTTVRARVEDLPARILGTSSFRDYVNGTILCPVLKIAKVTLLHCATGLNVIPPWFCQVDYTEYLIVYFAISLKKPLNWTVTEGYIYLKIVAEDVWERYVKCSLLYSSALHLFSLLHLLLSLTVSFINKLLSQNCSCGILH